MQLKPHHLLAIAVLALGLAACHRTPGIIKFPTAQSNLKNAPHDTEKQDKQAAAQTHTQLAAMYMKHDDLKKADETLHKALQFDSKYIPAHTLLAILNWRIQRYSDANSEFRAAIALDPSNGDTNNNYGRFLCARGKEAEAMGYFTRALADPFYKTPVVAQTNAGECEMKSGKRTSADTYLAKALEIDAKYGPALLAMAQLKYQQGDAFDARGFLQRFESAGQATPASLLLGYDIATRLGNRSSAASYSQRLQDQFPDSTQAQSLSGSKQ